MRSWPSVAGLLLSLAGHGALLLVLGWVWVGESPPAAALVVDLAEADGPAAGAGAARDIALPGQGAREASSPAARARPARRAVRVPVPSPPPTARAVEPAPVPMAPPSHVPRGPAPPDTPRPPRPLPPPTAPGATPPPVAMLDVPRPASVPPERRSGPGVISGSRETDDPPPARAPADGAARESVAGERDGRTPAREDDHAGDAAAAAAAGSRPAGPGADAGRPRAGSGASGSTSDVSGANPSAGSGPLALALPGTGDAAGAEYRAYYEDIRRLIRDSLRYPAAARRQGLSGTVELELEVRPSGSVAAVAVVRSSSHRVLDDAALEAARTLPRMPFPPGVQPRALRVRIPVDFALR